MGNSDCQLFVFGRAVRRAVLCGCAGGLPAKGWRSPLPEGGGTRRVDCALARRDRLTPSDLRSGPLVSLLQAVPALPLAEPHVDRVVAAGAVQRRRLCVLL